MSGIKKIIFVSVICLLKISVATSATGSRLSFSLVKCEEGVVVTEVNQNGAYYFVVKATPSTRTPAVYFGSIQVSPGKTYTYFLKGQNRSTCSVRLYVTTQKGDLVWPGNELKSGITSSVFTVPSDIDQITLALAFIHPLGESELTVQDIALFEGALDIWSEGSESMEFVERPQDSTPATLNLFSSPNLKIRCESGITAVPREVDERELLKVRAAQSPGSPSIYFGPVKVIPGRRYTYFLRGIKSSQCRVLLYVVSPKGNVVWPGGDVLNGVARSWFMAPMDTDEVTLAMTFLSPQDDNEAIVVEDLALFSGHIDTWPGGLRKLDLTIQFHNSKPWAVWVLSLSFLLIIAALISGRSNNRQSGEALTSYSSS